MAKQKAQTPKKAVSKPESDSPTYKKEQKPRYFTRSLYIPNFGMVVAGDVLTEAAHNAWKSKTNVSIDGYVKEKELEDK